MNNVLIADDHAIIRAGIKIIIGDFIPDLKTEEAEDAYSAFELIRQNAYHLIILDIQLGEVNAYDLVKSILSFKPDARILMIAKPDEKLLARKYLQLGAMGYLLKDATAGEVRIAAESILSGRRYVSAHVLATLTKENYERKYHDPMSTLSTRETEIVTHLVKGESLKEICDELKLSASTISTYKSKIYEKLHCKNVIEIESLYKLFSHTENAPVLN